MGKYLVCDQVKQRLTIHRETGDLLQAVEIPEVTMPQFMCSHANRLYICDGENKEILVYRSQNSLGHNYHHVTKLTTPGGHRNERNDQEPQSNLVEKGENHMTSEFLDCSAVCTDTHGSLIITDARIDKIHSLNERGEMSNIIPFGRPIRRPTCIAISLDGTMAVAQQGTDLMDRDISTMNHISIYKMMRADV